MSKKKAEIIFKEYDTENFIVFITRDSKNLFMDMGLCNCIVVEHKKGENENG